MSRQLSRCNARRALERLEREVERVRIRAGQSSLIPLVVWQHVNHAFFEIIRARQSLDSK